MAQIDDRLLYIGTQEGLYSAEHKGGGYQTTLLGLTGAGVVRYPVVVDDQDSRRIYAGTAREGVQRSEDGGASWHEANKGIVFKEVWSIAQHPMTHELVAGTGPACIFKSANGGDSWSECMHLRTLPSTIDWTFPNPPHVAHVKGLGLCADDPSLIYGSVEEGWAIRSRDAGATWVQLKDGIEFDLHYITVMPDKASEIVATSGQGIFHSFDGGDSWEESTEGLSSKYLAALVVHPKKPNVFFTAAAAVPPPFWRRPEGADAGFFRSDNRGASWHRLSGGLPDHFAPAPRATAGDPEDPDAYYVGMTDGSVWMSGNGGDTFSQILTGLPQISSLKVAVR